MRKIIVGVLVLFAIAVFMQDYFKGRKAKTPIAPRPYVVMLSLDGFRYDYQDKTNTPILDSIEKSGIRAKALQPVFPTLTFPNHYSIATGLYAGNHSLVANHFYAPELKIFYSSGKPETVQNNKFYKGEPIWVTAESQRLNTASYFWVGTEANIKGYQPKTWKSYDAKVTYPARLDSIIKWLDQPYPERPHLSTCYIELTDNLGHQYGPNSTQITSAVAYLDSLIGEFMNKLNRLEIKDSINIIIISDHGMAPTDSSKIVYLDKYIKKEWVDTFACTLPFCMIYSKKNCSDSIYRSLQNVAGTKVWKRGELPERFHLNQSEHVGDVVVLADSSLSLKITGITRNNDAGTHGYDNLNPLMNGIFYAIGPSFKKGYSPEMLYNIDIYNLLCRILEIRPAQNDGKPERIESVLR